MDDKEKQEYLEQYHQAKEKGIPFYPDAIFKDAVVVFVIFLILVALAYFAGTPLEARANPADTSYTPRPEWYFLFLFQLLKYFPGNIEVLGVVVLPTVAILLLFALPLIDRSAKRHYSRRLPLLGVVSLVLIGIGYLTVQAYRETPPPAEATGGDPTAALYAKNCAGCHGSSIQIQPGTNLHAVITQGNHEGMPAWSADLSSDQIDALAGFILSPGGSQLFTQYCSACHEASQLVAGDPLELSNAIKQGTNFAPHTHVDVTPWDEGMDPSERTILLNFLVAPDGQRLFTTNCSPCHGRAVAFSGDETQLAELISKGGSHLEMPPWRERLSDSELDSLSRYVVEPSSAPDSDQLFKQYCASCHGERVPKVDSIDQARQIIAGGGAHQTMPVWGSVLTSEQLDALTRYTLNAAKGTSLDVGQELFAQNCATCHGDFGEGGVNPTRPNDIITPISTGEFLKTRDDYTLRAIIAQGQPDFGMSPFGSSFGGPLDEDAIDAILAYIRSWEANPPVQLPPEIAPTQPSLSATDIYKTLCSQCHGPNGEGGVGPPLADPKFQSANSDQDIFDTITLGHKATAMIGWGEILGAEQIQELVQYIRKFKPLVPAAGPTPTPGPLTFAKDILPIFKGKCVICHGALGGWDSSSFQAVMTTGDNAPAVVPGDAQNSLLAQKLLGTQTEGTIMPPGGKLPDSEIQLILDWIAAGALEK